MKFDATRSRDDAQPVHHLRPRLMAALLAGTAIVAVGFASAGPVQAQTWDGETNTLWGTAANWDPNGVPAAAGDVVIDSGALDNQPTLNVNSNALNSTTISSGTLTVDAVLTSTTVTLDGTGNMTINAGDGVVGNVAMGSTGTLTNNGTITGNLGITDGVTNNAGVVTGSTSISGGVLNLNTGTNLADAQDFTVNGGTVNVNATDTVGTLSGTGGTINFAPGGSLTTNITGSVTYAGDITGSSNFGDDLIVVQGGGTLTLSGDNTATNFGRLRVDGFSNLVLQGGNAVGDAGVLEITAGIVDLQANETVGALLGLTTGTLQLNGNTLTIAGGPATDNSLNVTGTGGITVTNGSHQFNNALAYTGATTVTGGAFQLGANDIIADGSAVTVNGGTLSMQSFSDTVAGVSLQSGSITGTGTLTAASFNQTGGDMAGTLSSAGAKTLEGGTISGTLSGAGATTVQTGTTLLSGTINGGVDLVSQLNVDGGDVTGNIVLSGGTLNAVGDSTISGNVSATSLGGTISAADGATLTIGTINLGFNSDTSFGSVGNAGTVRLDNWGLLAGDAMVSIDAGTVQVGSQVVGDFVFGFIAGTSIAADAALDITGGNTTVNNLTGAGTVTNSGAADRSLTLIGSANFGGVIEDGAGGGTVALVSNGTNTLSGANTFTGDTTVSGGTLTLTGSLASTNVTVGGGTLQLANAGNDAIADTATVTVNSGTLQIVESETVGGLNGTGGTVSIDADQTLTLGLASGSFDYDGDVTGGLAANLTVASGAAGTQRLDGTVTLSSIDVNGGTLVLSGTNSIGQINVDEGTLRLESNGAAGGAAGQIVTTGSVIDYADGVNIATPITLNSNDTQLQVTTGTAEQSGDIDEIGGPRPLEKIGLGELILSGTNTFTGDMTITAGTLTLTGGTALADTVEVVVGSGATLQIAADEDIGALSSGAADATVAVGGNSLVIVGAQNTTYAGQMTGTGAFINDGSGTLTLTGDGSGFTGVIGATGAGSEIAITGGGTTGATGVGSSAGATFSTDGGAILATNAVLAADGQVTFTGSETIGTVTNAAATGIANGTITLTGAGTILTVNGSANGLNPGGFNGTNGTIDGTGTLNVTGGSFNVGATGDVQTATTIGAAGTVVNAGTMAGVTNAGTFTNNATGTAGAVSNSGTGSNAGTIASLTNTAGTFTNSGAVTGDTSVSGGTIVLAAGSNLADAGTVAVSGTGTLTVNANDTIGVLNQSAGTIDGNSILAVGGAFTQSGGATGGTVTITAASFTQSGGATVGAGTTVTSSGAQALQGGTIAGTLDGTGAITVTGDTTITATGVVSNSSGVAVDSNTLTVDAGGQVNVATTIAAAGTLDNSGTVADVTNAGTFTNNAGATAGAVSNSGTGTNAGTIASLTNTGGTFGNTGAITGTMAVDGGTVTNNATGTVGGASTVAAAGTLLNFGTLADVTNAGTFTNNVGATAGAVSNSGTGSNAGTIASLANTGGTFSNLSTGTITGGVVNSSGATFNAEGTILGAIDNQAGGVFNLVGTGFTGNGVFDNAGTLNASGSQTISGITQLNNTGTIDLQNGVITDSLVINGNVVLDGTMLVDIDLSQNNPGGVPQLSDQLVVNGSLSGTGTVNFAHIGGTLGLQDAPIVVIDVTGGPSTANLSATGLPTGGLILYQFVQSGEDWVVTSNVNLGAIGGIAGNISLVQAIIGSVVNRPSSAFVSGLVSPDPDEERKGFWMRGVGGTATGAATAFDITPLLPIPPTPARSPVELDYLGAQAGFDTGRYNIGDKGLEIALGVTAGYNFGDTRQDLTAIASGITTAEFDSRFAGAYISAFKGRLFGDIQVRFDQTDFEFRNPAIGLNGAQTSSIRGALIGSVGYGFTFGDYQFVPSMGMSLSRTRTDRVTFTDALGVATGTLDAIDYTSALGFASATFARQFLLSDEVSAITPFVTAAVYNDFGDKPTSLFTDIAGGGTTRLIQTENLETYGELSLGVNYLRILENNLRQLDAGIRADFKFGRQIEAVGVTAQMRLVF
jgi:fibronectin-binding autotransporter adhesin